ncbi:MAG: ATP-binding protein [Betaproteobacteria bacterium]
MRLSLFARMALILLAGLVSAQLASVWLQWGERATVVSQARGLHFIDRIADAVRLLEANELSQRKATLSSLQSADLRVTLIANDEVFAHAPRGQIQANLSARIGSEHEVRSAGGGGGGMGMQQRGNPQRSFDIRLRDSQWVRMAATNEAAAPALSNSLIVQLLITLMAVVVVVMLAVRQATKPLQTLAQAADTLGRNLDAPPLDEAGPSETRRAAQAFNRMQGRIKHLVNERSQALAAVSHDLRTPLTRLRLRTELVDDEPLREQMVADLESMSAMIDATLDYLRGLQDSEPLRRIDINALVHSLSDDAAVLGRKISINGQASAPYSGRLSALRRALQNLIDNAITYGQSACIRIDDDANTLRLSVEDEGPGIAQAELVRVTEPYYRPDASRSRETGGVGLGLSIVKDVALLHGGELLLANRPQGGLQATLLLPRQKTDATLS